MKHPLTREISYTDAGNEHFFELIYLFAYLFLLLFIYLLRYKETRITTIFTPMASIKKIHLPAEILSKIESCLPSYHTRERDIINLRIALGEVMGKKECENRNLPEWIIKRLGYDTCNTICDQCVLNLGEYFYYLLDIPEKYRMRIVRVYGALGDERSGWSELILETDPDFKEWRSEKLPFGDLFEYDYDWMYDGDYGF